MKKLNFDSLPHITNIVFILLSKKLSGFLSYLLAFWWGISLNKGCSFHGLPVFRRHPNSIIEIGSLCEFRSSKSSNLIGINRPCMFTTLKDGANIQIGSGCGFSGTVIGCAKKVIFGNNVRCGANTLITDTDWHMNDIRAGEDAPVEIGSNVWLGVNVIVLKGVSIGENTLIGAGSIVTKSIPSNVYAAGVPAKILSFNDKYQYIKDSK